LINGSNILLVCVILDAKEQRVYEDQTDDEIFKPFAGDQPN
jgi:hypothetical protein